MNSETQHDLGIPLVSVVITCYNHARFLSEAIESVLNQTYQHIEIIVVDDGSTDHTSIVASRYLMIHYIKQENRGLAAARNTGIRESKGSHLVFLDADDRLLPNAIEAGLNCFYSHPQSAFVLGNFRFIALDGTLLEKAKVRPINDDHYLALLYTNYIEMHATVMYRRSVLESVGGFDTSLSACEDYDLYLRIARNFQISCHNEVIAEYRRHDTNMSYNNELMLKTSLFVLRSQWEYVKKNKQYIKAYKAGMIFWKECYGLNLIRQIITMCVHGQGRQVISGTKALLLHVGGVTLLLYSPLWVSKYIVKQIRHLGFKR